jgi:hypothetical protein
MNWRARVCRRDWKREKSWKEGGGKGGERRGRAGKGGDGGREGEWESGMAGERLGGKGGAISGV